VKAVRNAARDAELLYSLVTTHFAQVLLLNLINYVGFEVFTAVTMKNTVFWDVVQSASYC
jgi:hypothetical protein